MGNIPFVSLKGRQLMRLMYSALKKCHRITDDKISNKPFYSALKTFPRRTSDGEDMHVILLLSQSFLVLLLHALVI